MSLKRWLGFVALLGLVNVGLAVSTPAVAEEGNLCGDAYDCACKFFGNDWGCFEEMEPVEVNCVRHAECM